MELAKCEEDIEHVPVAEEHVKKVSFIHSFVSSLVSLSVTLGQVGESSPRSAPGGSSRDDFGWTVFGYLLPNLVMCCALQNQVLCHCFCSRCIRGM